MREVAHRRELELATENTETTDPHTPLQLWVPLTAPPCGLPTLRKKPDRGWGRGNHNPGVGRGFRAFREFRGYLTSTPRSPTNGITVRGWESRSRTRTVPYRRTRSAM